MVISHAKTLFQPGHRGGVTAAHTPTQTIELGLTYLAYSACI